jgi:hypothetical protein
MYVNISSQKMSNLNFEQSININFCLKLGKSTSEMCAVFSETCGTEAMKKSSVFEWHKQLKGGSRECGTY